ncbi:MAG: imidazole glycerol phosphate synthase subunit HisH [Verrucomicrobia bacterium TMED56]|nr:MAG: imidazole glycerol phosphate synthase subunit HisH [Verrucomicrobia bacterium TMED56]
MKKVGVIDYGTGNLKSVVKAFEHLGAEVSLIHVSKDADEVDALVFPGQGTFDQCMGSLKQTGLDNLIKKWIAEDKPYFGICLGLQVLFCSSEEGSRKGLGLFDGKVKRFRLGIEYKIPHMGWNGVYWDKVQNNPLVRGLTGGDQFYFVHSYHIQQVSDNLTTFKTSYGYDFISGIYSGNCVATQFHPEKSQEKGLQLYRNFLEKVV